MLSVRDLDVALAGVSILRGVTFDIGSAETVALIGRNGAGKTTTLRAVMGLVRSAGNIRFDGAEISQLAPHRRPGRGIGYAPEDRKLFSAFTIEENILLPAQVARLPPDEVRQRLDRAYAILPELRDMAQRPAGAVSGGQGKMVALARALMLGTKLIMLDEPFQGLAPALAQRYADALRALRDMDKSVSLIITESNPGLLRRFADRAFLIERGEISSTSLQALESPQGPGVR